MGIVSSPIAIAGLALAVIAFLLALGCLIWLIVQDGGGNSSSQGGGGTVAPGGLVLDDFRFYVDSQNPQFLHVQYTRDNGQQWEDVATFDPNKKGIKIG
jgi:hypothetical protein